MSKFMDSIRAYNQQVKIMKDIQTLKANDLYGKAEPGFIQVSPSVKLPYAEVSADITAQHESLLKGSGVGLNLSDPRYNVPKEAPKAEEKLVEKTIVNTEIYRMARLAVIQADYLSDESRAAILEAQRKQVAYGIDKYPEPLNPNTWTISETVEHIMDESIDRLHYLIMLRIKLEQHIVSGAFNDIVYVKDTNSNIDSISRMIYNTIDELHFLVNLVISNDKRCEKYSNDVMDTMSYYAKSGLINYCKADADATLSMFAGADMDGDKVMYTSSDQDSMNNKE
jgi:hypothetical protein